jgi:allantoate deiminase
VRFSVFGIRHYFIIRHSSFVIISLGMAKDPVSTIMSRLHALGQISDEPGRLTRTFCSPAMRRANALVGSWMRQAGMEVRQDAIANLIGDYSGQRQKAAGQRQKPPGKGDEKILVLGSHLDTVRDAGKFDGPLGVLTAIACVERLRLDRINLPFAITVAGFADEEGVRYQSTYLGSKVLAGTFKTSDLNQVDSNGIRMAEAIRSFGGNPRALAGSQLDRKRLLGYVEVHIEQGPLLESKNLPAGVVTAIAGQTRSEYRFLGRAGHAGTVPMNLRRDALCAAAEFVLAVERLAKCTPGLVATVGQITALPGTGNVIPGEVRLSLDIRHSEDGMRERACADLAKRATAIGKARGVKVSNQLRHQAQSVACDARLSGLLSQSVRRHQRKSISLPSGAGHDAAAMAAITPVAMLFVRCRGGVSHHPDESVSPADVRVALAIMNDFITSLATKPGGKTK